MSHPYKQLSTSHYRVHWYLSPGKCLLHVFIYTKRAAKSAGNTCRLKDSDTTISNGKTSKCSNPYSALPGSRVFSWKESQVNRYKNLSPRGVMPLRTSRLLFEVDHLSPELFLYWTLSNWSTDHNRTADQFILQHGALKTLLQYSHGPDVIETLIGLQRAF
jgi:hypothetical protein